MDIFTTTVQEAIDNDELFELMSADPKYTLDKDGNYKIAPDLRLMGTTKEYVDPIDYIAVINSIESIYLDCPRGSDRRDKVISDFSEAIKQLISSNVSLNIYFAARFYLELAECSEDFIVPGIDVTIKDPLDQALNKNKSALKNLNKYSGKDFDGGLWRILKIENDYLIPEKKLTSLGEN